MRYISSIAIDYGRIDYELKNYGAAVVGVPGGVLQDQIDDAVLELKTKYDGVGFDVDGDSLLTHSQLTLHYRDRARLRTKYQ